MTQSPVPDFRDRLGNVSGEGKRIWLYPKKPSGKLYNYRQAVSVLLLALFFAGPFLRYKGDPLLLFNVLERKFILFGIIFWPQDFYLAVLAMLTFMVMVVVFTAVFGRIWCGWACPQTIFMEMVFRKIEYWIEGSPAQQKALDARQWDMDKLFRKTSKHFVFFLISFLISNTFLAYIIGVDQLKLLISEGPLQHWGTLGALLLFTAVFYWVFAKLREIVCIMICPYGRLQGVLLDKQTMVVAYDFKRGEPRGFRKKNTPETPKGDCVDCGLCVQVCPTGIDIRNGTQLECINCTACIDACNQVMDKVEKPRGLIRIASMNAIDKVAPSKTNFRVLAYSGVLMVLAGIFITLLFTRKELEATLLRAPGQLYAKTAEHQITNLYSLELVNKTRETIPVSLELQGIPGRIKVMEQDMNAVPGDILKLVFIVEVPDSIIRMNNTPLQIRVSAAGKHLETLNTNFVGPVNN